MDGASRDWKAVGRALAAILPVQSGYPAVCERIETEGKTCPWVVACSGGADSVALLLWWFSHFPGHRDRTRVLHINHHQRGAESDRDADFVSSLADRLNLAFIGERDASLEPMATEADLREIRLEAYRRHAHAPTGEAGWVLTGHHLDDVVETQMMWLARGAGSSGLAAPRPIQEFTTGPRLLRPFLGLPREAIREALERAGGIWREDRSNTSLLYTRNRMRREVVEAWKAASPGDAMRGAALTRQWMEEDAAALDAWVRRLYPDGAGNWSGALELSPLIDAPRAIRRRALWGWLDISGMPGALNAKAKELLLGEVEAWCRGECDARVCSSCGDGAVLEIRDGCLRVSAVEESVSGSNWEVLFLEPGAEVVLPDGGRIRARVRGCDSGFLKSVFGGEIDPDNTCCLDLDSLRAMGLNGPLQLRPWQAGDRYHPLGSPGSRKLQDCLTDRKIPEKERYRRPVVCLKHSETILWFPGLLPCESARLTDSSKRALCLTYTAEPAV